MSGVRFSVMFIDQLAFPADQTAAQILRRDSRGQCRDIHGVVSPLLGRYMYKYSV
ncbi:hypothetical protein D3C75_1212800 [compost metagenome]